MRCAICGDTRHDAQHCPIDRAVRFPAGSLSDRPHSLTNVPGVRVPRLQEAQETQERIRAALADVEESWWRWHQAYDAELKRIYGYDWMPCAPATDVGQLLDAEARYSEAWVRFLAIVAGARARVLAAPRENAPTAAPESPDSTDR